MLHPRGLQADLSKNALLFTWSFNWQHTGAGYSIIMDNMESDLNC